MSRISELEDEINRLNSAIKAQEANIRQTASEVEEKNRRELENLRKQASRMLEDDRQAISAKYTSMLADVESEGQRKAQQVYESLRAQYSELEAELEKAYEEESEKFRDVRRQQRSFESEYKERLETLRQKAVSKLEQAKREYLDMSKSCPVEWFMRGHLEVYRKQFAFIEDSLKNGLFEAVSGTSDNLILKMNMERADIDREFDRWYHYYSVLKELALTGRDMFFGFGRSTENLELSAEFYEEEGVRNNSFDEDFMNFWTQGNFNVLLEKFNETCSFITDFSESLPKDVPIREGLVSYMIKNPEKESGVSSEIMYRKAKDIAEIIDETASMIRSLHSRVRAYDERQNICAEICESAENFGFYPEPSESWYQDDDRRKTLSLIFDDENQLNELYVFIIPVFSQRSDIWHNSIGFVVNSANSGSLRQRVADFFSESYMREGIGVLEKTSAEAENFTFEQLINIFSREFQMQINGTSVGTGKSGSAGTSIGRGYQRDKFHKE